MNLNSRNPHFFEFNINLIIKLNKSVEFNNSKAIAFHGNYKVLLDINELLN